MSDKSSIEWTDATWNVLTGCTRVSEGCRNCYAERLAATRLAHVPAYEGVAEMTPAGPRWTGVVRFNVERLDQPLRWRRPRMVFVNSQSDVFHEAVTNEQIAAIFGIMGGCPGHTFQVLTKRPERAAAWFKWLDEAAEASLATFPEDNLAWRRARILIGSVIHLTGGIARRGRGLTWPLPNVWIGVSVEDQATADQRIPLLLQTPAAVRWVSAEPLLGPVDFANITEVRSGLTVMFSTVPEVMEGDSMLVRTKIDALVGFNHNGRHTRLDWIVVGGESGPGARPMHPAWAEQIRDACVAAEVPFFFKQWGEWAPGHEIEAYGWAPIGWYEEDPSDGGKERRTWPDGMNHGQRCPGKDTMVFRVGKGAAGRLLDGRTWDEMPTKAVVG